MDSMATVKLNSSLWMPTEKNCTSSSPQLLAVDGVDEWFVQELKDQGYDDGQDLVDLFTK